MNFAVITKTAVTAISISILFVAVYVCIIVPFGLAVNRFLWNFYGFFVVFKQQSGPKAHFLLVFSAVFTSC